MLTTTMSSEEVTGDTSLIFDIIARGKSRPMDGVNGHHRCRKAIRVCIDINSDNGCNRGTWLERREVIIGRKGDHGWCRLVPTIIIIVGGAVVHGASS